MNITFIFGPSATPPLTCDCAGAVVYLRLKKEHWGLSRDYHGTVRGTLQAREQAADGTWSYVIDVHESGLVTPAPELSGSMFATVCCQGCVSTAAEAYNQDEFGGRLVAKDVALALGRLFVRDTIRPFLISDWRVWVDTPGLVDVKIDLYVDGMLVTAKPLVIEAGETVSTALPEFITGATYRVSEGSLIEVEVVGTGYSGVGSAANGLETWFFGHLNPSYYFAPGTILPGGGTGPPGGGNGGNGGNGGGEAGVAVATIADLKALSISEVSTGEVVDVLGYYAMGDGGGGLFYYDSPSTADDNGGTVIKPTSVSSNGRWMRVYDGAVDAKWFGLKSGDPAANESNKNVWYQLFSYFAAGRPCTEIHIPDGDYYLNCNMVGGAVNIPSNTTIRMGKKTRIIVTIPTPYGVKPGTPAEEAAYEGSRKYIVFRLWPAAGQTIDNVLIEGGEIVGDKTTDLERYVGYAYGVEINVGCHNITVRDMIIRDCWMDNIIVQGGSDIRIENLDCFGGRRHCGAVTGGQRVTWVGCHFVDPYEYMCFDMEIEDTVDCEDVTFERCVFSGAHYAGLAIVTGFSGMKALRPKVINCEFFNHSPRIAPPDTFPPPGSGTAITIASATDFVIENCTFHDNDPASDIIIVNTSNGGQIKGCVINGGRKGMGLYYNQGLEVIGNTICNTSDDAIGFGAGDAAHPSTNNKVGFNHIHDIGTPPDLGAAPVVNGWGIGIDVRGTAFQIFNNRIERIQTFGIMANGAQNCLFSANKVTECGMAGAYPASDGMFIGGSSHLVFGNDVKKCAGSQSARARGGAFANIWLAESASPNVGDYVGYKVLTISGTGAGQTKIITAYAGQAGNFIATVDSGWSVFVDGNTYYEIIPAGNCQRYGIFNISEKSTIFGNDTNLGGVSGGMQESGIGTMGVALPTAGTSLALSGALQLEGILTSYNTQDATNGGLGAITTLGGIYAAKQLMVAGNLTAKQRLYIGDDIEVIAPGQPDLGKTGQRFRTGWFSSSVNCQILNASAGVVSAANIISALGVEWNLGAVTAGTPGAVTKLIRLDVGGVTHYLHAQLTP